MTGLPEGTGQRNGEIGPARSLTTFSERVSAALLACAPVEGRDKWQTALSFDTGLAESTIKNLAAGTVDASGPTLYALRKGLGPDGPRFIGSVFDLIGVSHEDAALARNASVVRAAIALCEDFDRAAAKFRKAVGK